MKQNAHKKLQVFRTLIRLIHAGDKAGRDDSHSSAVREKYGKQPDSLPSFSAGKYKHM